MNLGINITHKQNYKKKLSTETFILVTDQCRLGVDFLKAELNECFTLETQKKGTCYGVTVHSPKFLLPCARTTRCGLSEGTGPRAPPEEWNRKPSLPAPLPSPQRPLAPRPPEDVGLHQNRSCPSPAWTPAPRSSERYAGVTGLLQKHNSTRQKERTG